MNVLTLQSTYGGLLHDTGKAVYRAGGQRGSHSEQGYQFLHGVLPGAGWAPALDCVRYHHAAALRGAAKALPADSPAYIVYLADDLSAAADRREVEGESSFFRRDLPLDTVFTHLNGTHPGWMMPAQPQDGSLKLPRPQQPLSASVYADAVRKLSECLPDLQPQPEWINSLLGLLETQFSCFPSSTFTGESPDVSLFDHAKTTAAIAACISEYVQANITDLRKALFEQEKDFCQKDAFLLYTADFSRIQKFLYTVHTENALRSLRSRSFFLELLMEHYLDELLAGCGVSRANLIYSGGGHCYVLLPNTAAVADTLTRWNRQFNRWLQQQFGTQLFLANAWTPCSGNDLTNTPAEKSPYKELFRRVNRLLEQHKFHRYTAEDLRQLNSTAAYPDGRECKVCGTSANLKDDLCPWCKLFVDLSIKIQNKRVLVVSRQPSAADDCTLPALDGGSEYLSLTDPLSARKRLASGEPVTRVYTKNAPFTGLTYSTNLYVGDYAASNSMEELAEQSEGVRRIAVCRMDVDNLGHAFISGFEQENEKDPVKRMGFKPQEVSPTLSDKPTYQEAAELAHRLMDLYVAGEVDRVEIIYHHFKSMGVQILLRETYLPINLTNVVSEEDRENEEEVQENEIANDYIIEPNAEELIASLIPTVLSQKIFTAAVDSNASEHAARTLAMQVATDNANELIQDLTKQYNKSRQQAITNELLDIVGGSMK